MEQIQILEQKIKALEELISIKDEIISTLKSRPAQIQYAPYQQWYYYPYYWNQYQYYGAQGIQGNYAHNQMGGNGTLTINTQGAMGQVQQAANANSAQYQQYCTSAMNQASNQGSLQVHTSDYCSPVDASYLTLAK